MGKTKKTRKFAVTKKIISPKDTRVKSVAAKAKEKQEKERAKKEEPRQVEQAVSALFFQYNEQLGEWIGLHWVGLGNAWLDGFGGVALILVWSGSASVAVPAIALPESILSHI